MIIRYGTHKHVWLAFSITLTLLAGGSTAWADNPAYGIANTTAGTTLTVSTDTNQTALPGGRSLTTATVPLPTKVTILTMCIRPAVTAAAI